MTARYPVALSDRTLADANLHNVNSNNATPFSPTLKQNNPYAVSVLPSTNCTAAASFMNHHHHHLYPSSSSHFNENPSMMTMMMPVPEFPSTTMGLPSFQQSRPSQHNEGRSTQSTGFVRVNPYAKAHETLVSQRSPLPPSTTHTAPPQITKMYVDGRPVPVKKESAVTTALPPPLPSTVLVTVSFRLHTGTFTMDLQRVYPAKQPITHLEQLNGVHVIVDGDRGEDLGCIVSAIAPTSTDENIPRVRRLASAADVMTITNKNRPLEEAALQLARREAPGLLSDSIELVDAVFQHDRKKLTLYYTSDERVYFVPLTRALNQVYHCFIWMERVGGEQQQQSTQRASSSLVIE